LNIDVITTGNHVWDKREIVDFFQMVEGNGHSPARRVLRPANYPADMPGWGVYQGQKGKIPYAVINLQGRVFMASNDDPFRTADQLLQKSRSQNNLRGFPCRKPLPKRFLSAGISMAGSPP